MIAVLGALLHGQPLHAGTVGGEAPRFSESGPIASDTGYAMIAWYSDGPITLDITQNDGPASPRTLYSGGNTSYFVSGLADGAYTLTLRDEAGMVSVPLELTVTHQSLTRAFCLIALGLVVFLMIVAVILRGAR